MEGSVAIPKRNGLLYGYDAQVKAWALKQWGSRDFHLDLCVGILSPSQTLIGAIGFSNYNGSDAELHFYGPGTLRKDIVRAIFTIAIDRLNVNRITVRTRKPSMARGVLKLGAVFEGRLLRVYGPTDNDNDAANQYVFYRETMIKLAGKTQ